MPGFMQKAFHKLLAARAFLRIVQDPNRLGEVFKLSDRTDQRAALKRAADRFAMFPKGAQALLECRRLPEYRLEDLAQLPEGTLGRAFAEHMISRGLDPAAIPVLDAHDPVEFVRAHLYETHDIWHVVTGFDTDVAGELGLQAFYMSQVNGPLPPVLLAAGLLNTALFAHEEFDVRMRNIVVGWRAGKRAAPLFGTKWDLHWSDSLEEVRRAYGIDPRGVGVELRFESEVMTGLGGSDVYERAHARQLAAKRSQASRAPAEAQVG
jgi:ubiquinone biosynthesis protein COQ4